MVYRVMAAAFAANLASKAGQARRGANSLARRRQPPDHPASRPNHAAIARFCVKAPRCGTWAAETLTSAAYVAANYDGWLRLRG